MNTDLTVDTPLTENNIPDKAISKVCRGVILAFSDLIKGKDANMGLMLEMRPTMRDRIHLGMLTEDQRASLLSKLSTLLKEHDVDIKSAITMLRNSAHNYADEYYGSGEIEVLYAALLLEDHLKAQANQ